MMKNLIHILFISKFTAYIIRYIRGGGGYRKVRWEGEDEAVGEPPLSPVRHIVVGAVT